MQAAIGKYFFNEEIACFCFILCYFLLDDAVDENDGDLTALTVHGDGTLQRRDSKSIHEVTAILSFNTTPKVLDVHRLSKKCLTCTGVLNVKNIDLDLYHEIIYNRDCETNYDGSSSKLGFLNQRTENKSMLNFCVGIVESQGIHGILNHLLRFMFIVNEGTNEIRRKRHNTTKIETYRVNLPLIEKSHCIYILK